MPRTSSRARSFITMAMLSVQSCGTHSATNMDDLNLAHRCWQLNARRGGDLQRMACSAALNLSCAGESVHHSICKQATVLSGRLLYDTQSILIYRVCGVGSTNNRGLQFRDSCAWEVCTRLCPRKRVSGTRVQRTNKYRSECPGRC